jgi:FkbM family methyltransferase
MDLKEQLIVISNININFMNNLKKTIEAFEKKQIDKATYLDQMFAINKILFEFSEHINTTDILKIEINHQGVIFFLKNGLKFICDIPDKRSAPFEILNFRNYEDIDAKLLLKLASEANTILDIGANIGYYSMLIAKLNPNSSIHSFEPIPDIFKELERNVKFNGYNNIILNNYGCSDSEKTFEFYYDKEYSTKSSMQDIIPSEKIEKRICHLKKLDDYVKNHNLKIDLIKCDVEGAELFVYQGGKEIISTQKPIIFSEILRKWTAKFNYQANDILIFLKDLGYKVFISDDSKLKEISLISDETMETNFYFLHPDKHMQIIKKLS